MSKDKIHKERGRKNMKKYFYDNDKIINSPRKPIFTASEKEYAKKVLAVFENAKTKYACICFRASNNNIYKVYMPIERLTAQVKFNGNGKNKMKSKWRFLSPISKAQAESLVENGNAKFICTYEELKQMTAKLEKSNNGQGIEYMLAKLEHKKFNHKAAAKDGAEYDKSEVKYFDLFTGSGANATCPEYN
jgi:hypothetical protein